MIVLSDHPRWMFKKNSMGFFVGLDYYLYYFTVAVLLLVHDHVSFQNILWSPDLIIWSNYLSSLLFISRPYCMTWDFGLSAQMCGKIFPFWGSHNIKVGSVKEFQGQVTPETKLWQLSYLIKFDRNAKSSSFQPYKAVKSSCPMIFITLLDSLPVQDTLIVTIHLWPMYSPERQLVSVITRQTSQKSLSITPIMKEDKAAELARRKKERKQVGLFTSFLCENSDSFLSHSHISVLRC